MGTVYFKGAAEYKPGTAFTGGGGRHVQGDDASGAIRALDATTGKMRWEFPLLSPGYTSLLSTAGGLVFGGSEEGNFFALDAETGKPLWDTQIGGAVRGIPMSYAVDGKQVHRDRCGVYVVCLCVVMRDAKFKMQTMQFAFAFCILPFAF